MATPVSNSFTRDPACRDVHSRHRGAHPRSPYRYDADHPKPLRWPPEHGVARLSSSRRRCFARLDGSVRTGMPRSFGQRGPAALVHRHRGRSAFVLRHRYTSPGVPKMRAVRPPRTDIVGSLQLVPPRNGGDAGWDRRWLVVGRWPRRPGSESHRGRAHWARPRFRSTTPRRIYEILVLTPRGKGVGGQHLTNPTQSADTRKGTTLQRFRDPRPRYARRPHLRWARDERPCASVNDGAANSNYRYPPF